MKNVLLVDDSEPFLNLMTAQLRGHFAVQTANGASAAMAAIGSGEDVGVVVSDMNMPGQDGASFLHEVRQRWPEIVRVMLTANATLEAGVEAVNKGNVFRLLKKPCPPEVLVQALSDAMRQHQLLTSELDLLEKTLRGSVWMLTEMLALIAPQVFGRAEKLRARTRDLADSMRLPNAWELEIAAMVSQIGYVTVPPDVMRRAHNGSSLSPAELAVIEKVPQVGSQLLARIPRLEGVACIVAHSESLYQVFEKPSEVPPPEEIPLGARLLKIVSDFDVLETSGRSTAMALAEMRTRVGHYDPELFSAAAEFLLEQEARAKGRPEMQIRIDELRVGRLVTREIRTTDGLLLVAAGHRITPTLLQRLRNFSALGTLREPLTVEVE